MCEANVYMVEDSGEHLIMENVAVIRPTAEGLELVDLFGASKTVAATIAELQLVQHKVLLQPD